ncbi:XdhC family protein [Stenotrophomonas sp. WHRI 8082]|uniref:XdhC family protein n=1 Tax=Stenotrophomonas sp. WHRI 8082 TaxID=3162571 RepID=UPI0032ED0CD2
MTLPFNETVMEVHDAGLPQVLEACIGALGTGEPAAIAVVLETLGSTYARAGTVVLFAQDQHVGWLSGGCLEPEIERCALQAASEGRIDWMEIDTRDDAALFSGNAVGCRGCQRIALIPLGALPGCTPVLQAWLDGAGALRLALDASGGVRLACDTQCSEARLPVQAVPWSAEQTRWNLQWAPPPRVLLLGAGPEATPLVPALRGLGWRVTVNDPRVAWRERCALAVASDGVEAALAEGGPFDAVLVMHHNFELDLQALHALAATQVPFVGLLGPARRRDDLFTLLPPAAVEALGDRLRSPIGLDLGGRGPHAIALSIAAQLQAWRHASALPVS